MKKLSFLLLISLFTFQLLNAQCDADRHSALLVDHWLSCEMSDNPNIERGSSHWILYDFGYTYALNKSTFWNCNAYGNTEAGIRNYAVDFSNDGVNWIEFGEYELGQATASTFYEGEAGPDFDGLGARYILITALSTYESNCACLSEIRFETSGITVDVEDVNKLNLNLTLAPNPASDLVNLQIEGSEQSFDSEISILDQSGRLISTFDHTVIKGDSNIEISTNTLSSGNYMVKIRSAEGVLTRKLIIIKDHK